MIKITIDGKYYDVKPGKNLLDTCLSLGFDIPHFCFHPALGSVGACRLCAVKKFKDVNDNRGRIVMSCMEPVNEGLIISLSDPEVKAFRAAVIESLMTNHPHDCPVCDEGGECHLQDMTIMTGHNYRHFDFKKRTYRNQNLGPFIEHEMNRCIQCYRCVRFYRDYAGGRDLNVLGAHNHVYFGRHDDGTLENEFSGNLVEICPTGVFTDKTLKNHFTRKWDMTNAPSVCVHCSVGCNIIISERYGSLRRVMNRYNGAVNGYFLCDRGRFGYDFVNSSKRIKTTWIFSKERNILEEVDIETLNNALKAAVTSGNRIIGIGSPRASLESNFELLKLTGKENFYNGISKREQHLTNTVLDFAQNSGVEIPSLKQIESADAVVILGEDLLNTAPMMALAVRQSSRNRSYGEAAKLKIPFWDDAPVRELAQDERTPVYILTPVRNGLDDIAEGIFRASYAEIANLGFTVASFIDKNAPVSEIKDKEQHELARKISDSLKNASRPLVISGITCLDAELLHAAMNIAKALLSAGKEVMFSPVLPECNSMGMALMPGKSLDDAVSLSVNEEIDTLVVLENDLYRRSDERSIDKLLDKSHSVIVLDHLLNKTSEKADILLPSATFAESQGTLVNSEGRAQRYYKALVNDNRVKDSWQWIHEISTLLAKGKDLSPVSFDDVVLSMVKEIPFFSKLQEYMPDSDFRMLNTKLPRQTMRFSGRTAINSNISVSEQKIPADHDSPLAFTMEGQPEYPPSSLVPFYWAPGWNSVQALYKYVDEPGGRMKGGDPGIRLIGSGKSNDYPYFEMGSRNTELQKGDLFFVPVYQIFGSDELSSFASSLSTRIKEPFILLNNNEAERSQVENGQMVNIEISNARLEVTVMIENSLTDGLAGISSNLPGMNFIALPCKGKLYKT